MVCIIRPVVLLLVLSSFFANPARPYLIAYQQSLRDVAVAAVNGTATADNDTSIAATADTDTDTDTSTIAVAAAEAGGTKTPMLILHVGPSKTGTSSIQCTLQTTPLLKKSNYEYIAKFAGGCAPNKHPLQNENLEKEYRTLFNMIFKKARYASIKFKNRMIQLNAKNHSAIISAEEFSALHRLDEETWENVRNAISPYTGRTKVIVTYRHFHELLLSNFYERIVVSHRKKWNWKRPAAISFSSWWSKEMNNTSAWKKEIGSSGIIASFEKHLYNVTILNFHVDKSDDKNKKEESNDLVTRFICSLPDAAATCNAYKEELSANDGKTTVSYASLTDYAEHDRIAKEAYTRGLISREVSRFTAVDAIESRLQSMGKRYTDLPLNCCSEEIMDQLHSMSMEEGKAVLKAEFDEKALETSFEAYKTKKKYCTVNADALLEDSVWVDFFKNLTASPANSTITSRRLTLIHEAV